MSPPDKRKPGMDSPANATTKTYRQPESYSEDAATVGELVAAILDTSIDDPGAPPEIQDIFRLRAATRRVLEAHLHPGDEDPLLRALARQAARASLALWALEAMEAEILGPEAPDLLPPDVVARARVLRRWGHGACPTCRRSLLTESEIDRDVRRREWAEEDRAVRARAVPGEMAS